MNKTNREIFYETYREMLSLLIKNDDPRVWSWVKTPKHLDDFCQRIVHSLAEHQHFVISVPEECPALVATCSILEIKPEYPEIQKFLRSNVSNRAGILESIIQ